MKPIISEQDLITEAIVGGYAAPWTTEPCFCHGDPQCSKAPRFRDTLKAFQDPTFWQAVGKQRGWTHIHGNEVYMCRNCRKQTGANTLGACDYCGAHEFGNFKKASIHYALEYFEAKLESRNMESFFKRL